MWLTARKLFGTTLGTFVLLQRPSPLCSEVRVYERAQRLVSRFLTALGLLNRRLYRATLNLLGAFLALTLVPRVPTSRPTQLPRSTSWSGTRV